MDNQKFIVKEILSFDIIDKRTGEILVHYDYKQTEDEKMKCPLFDFCNCLTAMCRFHEPDESCYWYRYFKNLIKEKEGKI